MTTTLDVTEQDLTDNFDKYFDMVANERIDLKILLTNGGEVYFVNYEKYESVMPPVTSSTEDDLPESQ